MDLYYFLSNKIVRLLMCPPDISTRMFKYLGQQSADQEPEYGHWTKHIIFSSMDAQIKIMTLSYLTPVQNNPSQWPPFEFHSSLEVRRRNSQSNESTAPAAQHTTAHRQKLMHAGSVEHTVLPAKLPRYDSQPDARLISATRVATSCRIRARERPCARKRSDALHSPYSLFLSLTRSSWLPHSRKAETQWSPIPEANSSHADTRSNSSYVVQHRCHLFRPQFFCCSEIFILCTRNRCLGGIVNRRNDDDIGSDAAQTHAITRTEHNRAELRAAYFSHTRTSNCPGASSSCPRVTLAPSRCWFSPLHGPGQLPPSECIRRCTLKLA